jgi:hypothetical protein
MFGVHFTLRFDLRRDSLRHGSLRRAETDADELDVRRLLFELAEDLFLHEMELVQPRAVIDADVQDPFFHSERLSSRRDFFPNDFSPDPEDLLFFQSLTESDGFQDGGEEITDPRESFLAHV